MRLIELVPSAIDYPGATCATNPTAASFLSCNPTKAGLQDASHEIIDNSALKFLCICFSMLSMPFTGTLLEMSHFDGDVSIAIESVMIGLIFMYLISAFFGGLRRVKAPRVGKNPWISGLSRSRADFFKNGKDLTKQGYDRYKDSMYWIQTGDMERLVLSNRYLDELRRLPDSYLDSKQAVVERNLGWYNRVDIILKSTAHVDVCRTQLVQNLGIG